MISILEVFAKHADGAFAKLTQDDLKKNIDAVKRSKKMKRGRKEGITKYPSSRSKSSLKSAAYKVNDIKQVKLRKAERE